MNEKKNFLKLLHHWITAGRQRKLHSQETTLELKSDNIEMLRHTFGKFLHKNGVTIRSFS
jgi:hypothetical protein